ncbi:MAG: aromatic amino acid transport family protein [Parcubacteria group bacterium]
MRHLPFWQATATLVGSVIGAGVLGIPYVIARTGVLPGFLILIVLGAAVILINLMFTEIVLRTHFRHQIAGYMKKYLGRTAYILSIVALLAGCYGALTTYMIGEGEVLHTLFNVNNVLGSVIFFAIGALMLYFGLKLIKIFELWLVFSFLIIILSIFCFSGASIDFSNWQYVNWQHSFSIYGVILFAFGGGAAAVVPLREILRKDQKDVPRSVMIASFIPLIVYVLFSLIVVGVTGANTTEVATVGLGRAIGQYMLIGGNLFALFTMFTGFLTTGIILKEFFEFDMRFSRLLSWFLVIIFPIIIFLLGMRDFIKTMGIAGALTFGITGVLIILSFWRAKKLGDREPEFKLPKLKIVGGLMIVMFLVGLGYTIFHLVK